MLSVGLLGVENNGRKDGLREIFTASLVSVFSGSRLCFSVSLSSRSLRSSGNQLFSCSRLFYDHYRHVSRFIPNHTPSTSSDLKGKFP